MVIRELAAGMKKIHPQNLCKLTISSQQPCRWCCHSLLFSLISSNVSVYPVTVFSQPPPIPPSSPVYYVLTYAKVWLLSWAMSWSGQLTVSSSCVLSLGSSWSRWLWSSRKKRQEGEAHVKKYFRYQITVFILLYQNMVIFQDVFQECPPAPMS